MLGTLVLAAILSTAGASQQSTAQSQPTIRGTVIDDRTSAPIADARVTLIEASLTVKTGADGKFEFLHVPPKTYTLTVSTIGYIFIRRHVEATANKNVELLIPLAEGTGTYQETVNVSADAAARPKAIGVSAQMELGSAGLADLRGVAADDPMRAIQALPGVATGDDFQAEFSVRGSAFRHVGVVMDGTPTALLLHAIRGTTESGSVAMINSDILSRASLFGGPQTRQHGDWLGATLEFEVREGSRDRFGARAAISGTSSSGVFEGPLGPAKRGSWLVSIRRSYLDWLVRKIEPDVDSTIGFTDLQAKLVYDLTSRQQLQYLIIAGDARYTEVSTSAVNGLKDASSRSVLNSLGWRLATSRGVVSQRLSLINSSFLNQGVSGQRLAEGHTQSAIWRADVVVPLPRGVTIEGGTRYEALQAAETLRSFQSTSQGGLRVRFSRAVSGSPDTASAWGQATWRGAQAAVVGGARFSRRTELRGPNDQASVTLPWLLGEYTFHTTTIRAGAGRSAQFVDPVVVQAIPFDIVPEKAMSYDVSVDQPLTWGLRVQITGFHRTERDILRRAGEEQVNPLTGARISESPFPVIAPTLEGTSRGFELLVMRRATAGLSGWIGYTWAHTRYHDTLTGERFDADNDQRHTVNIFVQQRLSYRMTLSAKLRIGSNFPLVGYFEGPIDALRLSSGRNQVRLPTYSRLDVRANRTFTFRRSRLTLFVEVMNLLGRDNLRQTDGSIRANLDAVGFTDRLLPRVPSAGLLFEF